MELVLLIHNKISLTIHLHDACIIQRIMKTDVYICTRQLRLINKPANYRLAEVNEQRLFVLACIMCPPNTFIRKLAEPTDTVSAIGKRTILPRQY